MAKQRPTWAKRMKELQQMERKAAKAQRRAAKREGEEDDENADVQALRGPLDPDARAEMFDGLF
jgi:DNA-binding TFAR19-related protein (PDSD5 family)